MQHYPRRADDNGLPLPWMDRRVPQLLLDSGRAPMLFGALVLTWHQLATCNAEHMLAAFILWMLGAALVMLSLVARQFPGLAVAGAALAMALRNNLFGGL